MATISLIRLPQCPQKLSSKFRKLLPLFPCRAPALRIIQFPIKKISASFTPIPAGDRLISAATYFLPVINSIQHSHFVFEQYPILIELLKPLIPIFALHYNHPKFSAVFFILLYAGVALNRSFSRYVRFNALHAVALDLLVELPFAVEKNLFRSSPDLSGLGLKLAVWGYNALFVFLVVGFIHGLICSLLGITPYWPYVSEAAYKHLKD